jgi:hypothetical protein
VASFGVVGPKTAIEDGQKTLRFFSLAISKVFLRPKRLV